MTPEQNEYLNALQASGVTNMFGATPYIMAKFNLTKPEARAVLSEWMNSYQPTDREGKTQ